MLIKKRVIQDVGLLDPIFFFGWEDADFCLKVKRKGYDVLYVPTAKIWHKIGASYGGDFAYNPFIIRHAVKNQLIFMKRWAPLFHKILFILFFIIYLSILILKNTRKSIKHAISIMIAISNGLIDFIRIGNQKKI
jgi:GT2 family glycosyltransferase